MAPSTRSSSSSLNPFDSDDDDDSSNPFHHPSRPRHVAPRSRPLPEPQRYHSAPPTTNPFDDDSPGAPARNPFDDYLPSAPPMKPKRRSLDSATLFDDEPKAQADSSAHDGVRKSSMTRLRQRAGASGDAALKKAQKLKDAGANQASKLIEGSRNQAHRLKEGSYNSLKSSEGEGSTKADSRVRHELLSSEGERQRKGSYGTAPRVRYDDSQFQKQDLEYKSVQELEGYALQKSEETTKSVQNCVKVAENIREDATKTLLTLHEQGEQIRRTHEVAVDIDQNLTVGEKLLGSLGGMFSKTWKPKRSRPVTGPALIKNDSFKRRGQHLEQRVALGLVRNNSKGRNNRFSPDSHVQSHQQTTQTKLEMDRTQQDDALSDLSNILDQLKEMSVDMGSEIARQNGSLDHLQDDIITLNGRVKDANVRGRHLLKK